MVRILAFITLSMLYGCETNSEIFTNHGYGYDHHVALPSGMRVQYHGNAAVIDEQLLNTAYLDTIECAGLDAPSAPLVAFVDYEINNNSEYLLQGRVYLDTGLIVVMSLDYLPVEWAVLVFKHELVHYLLWANDVDDAVNMAHDSELFGECSY